MRILFSILCLYLWAFHTQAETIRIAVASNFKPTLVTLLTDFEQQSGHRITLISASTGVLYQQIQHGAPFDIFLSADSIRPKQLERDQKTVLKSRFTYAKGQLALAGRHLQIDRDIATVLAETPGKLAIANPKIAPYGQAAAEALKHLTLYEQAQKHIVLAANVNQAYQFTLSGNAALGLVSLAQLKLAPSQSSTPSLPYQVLPAAWYRPIKQQAVLLKRAKDNPAAIAFMAFLKHPNTQALIKRQGYLTGDPP